ncbi:MAG: PAS domain S-box protein [Bacteroidales bacterium]|nr:PAS domain S-box protein [Bacteroidales bacterium]
MKDKMVSNIGDVIVIIDQNEINQYKSPNITKLFGWKPEELIGKNTWDIVHPDDLEAGKEFYSSILNKPNASGSAELRYRRKDGKYVWIKINLVNLLHDNDIQGVLGNYHDISERKQLTRELLNSEETLKSIVENSLDSIWFINTQYEIKYINNVFKKAFSGAFGVELKLGSNILKYLPEEIRPTWKERYDLVLKGKHLVFEDTIDTAEAKIFVEVAANPIVRQGKVIGASMFGRNITERKQAVLKLQQSENRYRTIFNSTGTVTLLVRNNTYIEMANEEAKNVTGYTALELTGTKWTDHVAPHSLEKMLHYHQVRRTNQEDVPEKYEVDLIHKSGEIRRTLLTIGMIPNSELSIVTLIDVTERYEATEKLKESEEKFRIITENSSDIIWHLDNNFLLTYISPADERIRGFKREEVIGTSLFSILKPEGIEMLKEANKKRMTDLSNGIRSAPAIYELEELCKDGSWVWVEATATAFYDRDGKISGYHGVSRDISERKKAEEQLKESEEKLGLLIKNSNDIIILANEKGEQTFISNVVENITGYTAEELYGNILDVIHPDDVELVSQHWTEVLSNPKKTARVQYRHKHKVKGYVWLEAVAQNFLDNPSFKSIVANIRDITNNKESESQLRELNSTKDKLFSIIAHDLRSPFNSILGFSGLLEEQIGEKNYDEVGKSAKIIGRSPQRAMDLLENLLEWSRAQTGRIEFSPESFKMINSNR